MIKSEITNLRSEIDQIDESIAKLLSKRVECAVKIGSLKDKLKNSSKNNIIPSYDPVRENKIIERLKKIVPNIPLNGIEIIFRQIISLCRNSAHKSTICVLGETNEFDFKQYFGNFSQYIICSDFSFFVEEMKKSEFNIGIVIGDIKEVRIQELERDNYKIIDTFAYKSKTIRVFIGYFPKTLR